ncbi:MAG: MoaD/ThiS family protein [Paucibacter sp.]|nr:MoaD/ThiS family protein [Roseateles sp.]
MITVRYFASLREQLGTEERILWRQGLTLASLRDALIGMDSSHAAALSRERAVRCALNQQMSKEDALIPDGAEVAFFPPVTGG